MESDILRFSDICINFENDLVETWQFMRETGFFEP